MTGARCAGPEARPARWWDHKIATDASRYRRDRGSGKPHAGRDARANVPNSACPTSR
jgi:hypothetical protein